MDGVIGVVDFYTQSGREFGAQNYTGSHAGRHVNWFLRSFWRSWFELDHISVDAARRDYLEFKFGTVLTVNARNRGLGWIPYYIWLGRRETMQSIDQTLCTKDASGQPATVPLPTAFYQNHAWRLHYHDQLPKHTQFHDEYIYAFTWEDARQDHALLRPALLSPLLCKLVVSQESFLWKALGVPKNQLAMIEADHSARARANSRGQGRWQAVWRYMVDTLDPVAQQTHIANDNPYYYVCLAGQFSETCHPEYLSAEAHALLSQPSALDNLHLHTDEIAEVLRRITPASLTVAVLMDSMDWFDPGADSATAQITLLNRAMKIGGRVLLRSAALRPWYLATFTTRGFTAECVGQRAEGSCIDRVNMYASCWICTKVEDVSAAVVDMLEG